MRKACLASEQHAIAVLLLHYNGKCICTRALLLEDTSAQSMASALPSWAESGTILQAVLWARHQTGQSWPELSCSLLCFGLLLALHIRIGIPLMLHGCHISASRDTAVLRSSFLRVDS